jgi:hypothetical protein
MGLETIISRASGGRRDAEALGANPAHRASRIEDPSMYALEDYTAVRHVMIKL